MNMKTSNSETIHFIDKLKQRWQVQSLWQVMLILLTFTLTGSTVVYLRKALFSVLDYNDQTPFWIKAITYLVFIFPAYQILILIYGSILGQFRFFWEKEKRLMNFIKHKLLKL